MNNYNKGGFRGGGGGGYKGGFKGGSRGGDRGSDRGERGPITMHSAICSSCGKTCEVPFRPSGEKPVYCRDCFAGRSAMGGDRSQRKDPRTFSQNTFQNNQSSPSSQNVSGNSEIKKQIEAMNVKLDKIISLFQESVLKSALIKVTDKPKEIATVTTAATVGKVMKVKKAKKSK